jgi:hypothetical protein
MGIWRSVQINTSKHPEAYQITSKRFCAGFTVRQDGVVNAAAPIIWKKIINKQLGEVQKLCKVTGWKLEKI